MGLGRFAFTPMLPIMLHEGKLDLQAGGVLASLNYLGYFVGALVCAAIRVQARRAWCAAAWWRRPRCCSAWGLLHGFSVWGVLRTAAGVVSAWTFVFASGLGPAAAGGNRRAGLGGRDLHRARHRHRRHRAAGWRGRSLGIGGAAWIGFGLLSLVLIALIWRIFDDGEHGHAGAPGRRAAAPTAAESAAARSDARWLVRSTDWRASATSSRRPSCR